MREILEEKLSKNLLSNEIQLKMYAESKTLKHYGDLLSFSQSEENATAYQQAVMNAFESAVEIYEWLQEKNISDLNALIILGSFYLINLSDESLKAPSEFSDSEITNMINSFLWGMGAYGKVDTSSYNDLVRVGVNWLLMHPRD